MVIRGDLQRVALAARTAVCPTADDAARQLRTFVAYVISAPSEASLRIPRQVSAALEASVKRGKGRHFAATGSVTSSAEANVRGVRGPPHECDWGTAPCTEDECLAGAPGVTGCATPVVHYLAPVSGVSAAVDTIAAVRVFVGHSSLHPLRD